MNELSFLYQLLGDLYQPPKLANKVSFQEINLDKLIDLSLKNNVFYYLSCKLVKQEKCFKTAKTKGLRLIEKIKRSFVLIKNYLPDHLVIKTYRAYPRIPNDLDIIVKDFKVSLKKLKDKNFKVSNLSFKKAQAQLIKKGFYKIHLHGKLNWAGSSFMDSKFIWQQPRVVNLSNNLTIKIPNFEADFLIHLAHINFENLHFTLPELLYLYKIAPKLNWSKLFEQSKKYHWQNTLGATSKILDQIHHQLYKKPKALAFPMTLPRTHIVKSWLEKQLFAYALSKLGKSLCILIKGDTYAPFHQPAETVLIK